MWKMMRSKSTALPIYLYPRFGKFISSQKGWVLWWVLAGRVSNSSLMDEVELLQGETRLGSTRHTDARRMNTRSEQGEERMVK